jgi:outer membrane protein OmpU
MRKLLLTSTALVAATSMINYASADVSVSGGFEWGYTSQSSQIAASNGDSYRVDNEVVISFTNKTDTGLTITGRYDVDGDAASVDESSITIAGGFGTIRLGQDDGAADAFGVDEGDLVGEDASYAAGSSSILTNASGSGNNDNNKIAYFTPAMGGLKAGISFEDSGANTAANTDRTEYGASYTMSMGGASVVAEYNSGSANNATAGQLSTDHSNYGVTVTQGALSVLVSHGALEDNTSDSEANGMSVKYDMGNGMYVAAMAVDSEDDKQSSAANGSEKYSSAVAEVGYTVAPGLTAKVTHIDYDYERGNNTASTNDNGSATRFTLTAAF